MWWTKFKADANINGFSDAIREKPNPDMPTSWFDEIDLTTETGKKTIFGEKNEQSSNGNLHNGFHKRRDYAFGY
jgi:hypothetical protein